MKKDILTEINRNREIMGLGPIKLLNESIVGGVDDLIKLVLKKLSYKAADASTTALRNEFKKLTKKGISDADKLENIIGFVRNNSNVFDDVFMRDFRKLFIDKLPQDVKDELTILRQAVENGSVPEDKIYDLLTDPAGGVMRNADSETVKFMEDYFKTFLPKSTPNVTGVAAKLQQMAQADIQRFADDIESRYTVTLSQGGKKAEIVTDTVNKIRSLPTLSPEARIQIGAELEKQIEKVKDPWIQKYLLDLWQQSKLVRFSVKTLLGLLTLYVVNEIIEKFTGLDFNTAIITFVGGILGVVRDFMPDEDYQELEKRVKKKIPKENIIPITTDDAEQSNPSGSGKGIGDYNQ